MRAMMTTFSAVAVLTAVSWAGARWPADAVSAAEVQALPPGHPEPSATDAVPQVPRGAGAGANSLTWTVPREWKAQTPSSSMRRAQYLVPGPGGDAECVVFYFGPGQGGDAASNARRWAGQFRQPDGRDPVAAMKTGDVEVGGLKVTTVEVKGTYSGGMGGTTLEKARYQLLGAIAAGPDANWFFKLTGPETTVTAQRAAFDGLVRSLKKGS
jgi:hypothetical protein